TVDDVKEEKGMYVEQGRGNNFRGRGFGRSVVVEVTMKKGNNETGFNKIIEEEDMMTVEKVVHTNVIIVASRATMQEIADYQKEWKKMRMITTNLVTEEGVNVDGIVMMAYEVDVNGIILMANKEVVPKTNTTWYLNTGVGNHMCEDKQLHEKMKEVVDG
ncbi:hypothetical protein Tco_0239843, partial [Tanacetum coccineum]